MRVEQRQWTQERGWASITPEGLGSDARLVFVFGSRSRIADPDRLAEIQAAYPGAHLIGCSTAGEICGTRVSDDSLVTTALRFESTPIETARVRLADVKDSFEAGRRLAAALPAPGLSHVFVLSDGLKINGSELVRGLAQHLPTGVSVTGGLSGDGADFRQTLVMHGGRVEEGVISAIGFYGRRLRIGCGSLGGWDPFGPERRITRAKGNVLHELDGTSALALYKRYLGDYASGLPATGLLFPLSVRADARSEPVVRTILAVGEDDQSVTFAGDMPVGGLARMMKANFERLIDGAVGAARTTVDRVGETPPDLGILISCVGRKLVLKQRIEEEVEGVRDVLGTGTVLTGFYSYGEISPFTPSARCELHNQTMTITTFRET